MSQKSAEILTAPVGKTIIKLAIPMLIGIIAMVLFNIVDTYYVGQLGAKELTAMSYTFPIVSLFSNIGIGLGIGLASAVAKAIGENNRKKVIRLTSVTVVLTSIIILLMAFLCYLLLDQIFLFLGATPELLVLIHEYMDIYLLFIGFLMIPMVANFAIRATGDTKTPSILMVSAGIVNMILDPLLIFGIDPFPELRLQGAAIATAASWCVVLVGATYLLTKREKILKFKKHYFKNPFRTIKEILFVGIPAIGTNMLIPVTLAALTKIIAMHGQDAVAAFGVGSKIESLFLIGFFALTSVITPFVGQNLGAKKYDRIYECFSFCKKITLYWSIIFVIIIYDQSNLIAVLFSEKQAVIERIVIFLSIVPISFGFYGFTLVANSMFNALQKPFYSTSFIIIRLLFFIIPLAYFLGLSYNLEGTFWGILIANMSMGMIAYFVLKRYLHRLTLP